VAAASAASAWPFSAALAGAAAGPPDKPGLSLGQSVAVALVTGLVTGLVPAIMAYLAARQQSRNDLDRAQFEFLLGQRTQLLTSRRRLIDPLKQSTHSLSARIKELDGKIRANTYAETASWFKQLKDHMDGHTRMSGFAAWCYYEGIFATTTIYYTARYFRYSSAIIYGSPFDDLDSAYGDHLGRLLANVREAFGGIDGVWDSSQDVLGESIATADSTLSHAELCKIVDSSDPFRFAPLLRLLDFYIAHLDLNRTTAIARALDELGTFLTERALLVQPQGPVKPSVFNWSSKTGGLQSTEAATQQASPPERQ
jgi:hypothetical protein